MYLLHYNYVADNDKCSQCDACQLKCPQYSVYAFAYIRQNSINLYKQNES